MGGGIYLLFSFNFKMSGKKHGGCMLQRISIKMKVNCSGDLNRWSGKGGGLPVFKQPWQCSLEQIPTHILDNVHPIAFSSAGDFNFEKQYLRD